MADTCSCHTYCTICTISVTVTIEGEAGSYDRWKSYTYMYTFVTMYTRYLSHNSNIMLQYVVWVHMYVGIHVIGICKQSTCVSMHRYAFGVLGRRLFAIAKSYPIPRSMCAICDSHATLALSHPKGRRDTIQVCIWNTHTGDGGVVAKWFGTSWICCYRNWKLLVPCQI